MQNLKIAVLGLGTVGSGTFQLLTENQTLLEKKIGSNFVIDKVVVKDFNKKRDIDLKNTTLTSCLEEVLNDDSIELIFDATGDNNVGRQVIAAANNNKKVITANKALLAENWGSLNYQICNPNFIAFEAAVGGAIPIIDILKNGLSANEIFTFYGIINGTCNYILCKMEQEEKKFEEVLQEAVRLGYAELDPSLDVGGVDSAHKLIIAMNLIYQGYFDFKNLQIEGIEAITPECLFFAKKFNYSIKLLATTKKDKNNSIYAYVHPTLIPTSHPLSKIDGVENAIYIEGNFCGATMVTGAGAGAKPTASAMVSDMVQIINQKTTKQTEALQKKAFLPITEYSFEYFCLFDVQDKLGVLKSISELFYENDISIHTMLQEDTKQKGVVKIILFTHLAQEKKMLITIQNLQNKDFIKNKIQFLRIL